MMRSHNKHFISLAIALLSLSACPQQKPPSQSTLQLNKLNPTSNPTRPPSPSPLAKIKEPSPSTVSNNPSPTISPSSSTQQTLSSTPVPAPQKTETTAPEKSHLIFQGNPKQVSQIHIIPSIRTIAHKSESTTFSLLIKDINEHFVDPQKVNIVWSVKHPKLFEIDPQGTVTALTPSGFTEIIASHQDSGVSASAKLTMGSSGGPPFKPTPAPIREPIKKLETVKWIKTPLVSDPDFNHGAGAIGPAAVESLRGLALSQDGTKVYGGYILCCGLSRIREYSTETGAYTNQEDGNTGVPPASFAGRDFYKDIETDQAGNIYIATSNADRVAVYTSGNTLNNGVSFFVKLPLDTGYNISSEERPEGLSVQGNNLYVSTVSSDLIYRYTLPLTAASLPVETIPVAGAASLKGIAVDPIGNIYIVDSGTKKIIKINAARTQTTLATMTSGPRYIALGPTNQLYITTQQSIEVYDTEGTHQESLVVNANSLITKDYYRIDIDSLGNIYITKCIQWRSS